MHFKHPEIFWALFLLLIPILVHLFQLRKFRKTSFTNVKFLKAIQLRTRKSSQVKKWLVLASRLLLLTCLVLAFAQPYFRENEDSGKPQETVIYLDNSFSMQASGTRGELLSQAVRDILAHDSEGKVSLFTNDASFRDVTIPDIKQELLQLDYTSNSPAPQSILLRGRNMFNGDTTTRKNFVLISDFQGWSLSETEGLPDGDSLVRYNLVQLSPQSTRNVSVDSIYIPDQMTASTQLTVLLSKNDSTDLTLPVSLYDGKNLIAKTTAGFDNSDKSEAVFRIEGNGSMEGKVIVEDDGLWYDNTLYFNLNPGEKSSILAINQADDDFLKKIFTEAEFHLTSADHDQLDYSLIPKQDLIVLNGLNSISGPLLSALEAFYHNGKHILIIPSGRIDKNPHNQLFNILNIGSINKTYSSVFSYKNTNSVPVTTAGQDRTDTTATNRKKITDIRFSHPLYKDVFNKGKKQLTNFQYPEAEISYELITDATTILAFEDNSPFLAQKDRTYFFTAALDLDNSDFKNSPLIVPTLYNIGKSSLQTPGLYYLIGRDNNIDIRKQTGFSRDAIVSLEKDGETLIPLQRSYPDKIRISTGEVPAKDGTYQVKDADSTLQHISFNYDRRESIFRYPSFTSAGASVYNSVGNALEEIKNTGSIRELWKWFVIFAIVFLVIEILLLKYFK
ncbi:BatA domain-containing protein [Sinomicrobium weinanense]|uniref:BatA domain-containing protein n=1 Tax=Sinomicrobium weinanense TaxID=2842200 RepID=A0A926JNU3_9FLAO|nr:BatA domain-containing protein [Sinomicrobium weinanense]MBC9794730.1 BatA domain-containing protein [Sinomicrobium weinanense]MBU3124989.1 BatA domain-containing protein [Sinomicrobium weinanense]